MKVHAYDHVVAIGYSWFNVYCDVVPVYSCEFSPKMLFCHRFQISPKFVLAKKHCTVVPGSTRTVLARAVIVVS